MRYLVLCTALVLLPVLSQAGKVLYRYTDDQGQIVLKDSLPPNIAPKGYSILNEKGRVIEIVKPAKTPEELAAQAQAELEQKRLEAEQQRQQNEENSLRSTFSSTEDIIRARDTQVAALEVQVGIVLSNLNRLNEDLKNWQRQAANYERENKPIPQALTASMNSTLAQIDNSEADVQLKRDEQQQIRSKFTQILRQFQLMTSRQAVIKWQAQTPVSNLQVVSCTDAPSCATLFQRLATALQEQAHLNRPELSDHQLLLSHLPTADEQIGYWLAQVEDRHQKPHLALRLFCRETPAGRTRCQSPQALQSEQLFRQLTGTH